MDCESRHCQRSRVYSWLLSSFLLISLSGLYSTIAWGQLTSGSLTGVVTDPSGAAIPGAKVVLTDVNKSYDWPATTDAAGRYLITNLPPSTYRISAQTPGFKTFSQKGIVIDVGSKVSVDIRLDLGTTTQTVEVKSAAPLLETQDAVTGQEIDRTFMNNLPLYGRSGMDLAFLSPGVSQAIGVAYGPGQGNNFSSNGGRNSTNELLIDGVSATTNDPNTTVVDVVYTPSVDAIQEFKIVQNNYTAEEGFSGNTYVNMVMRSGTNSLHGSLHEFMRNNKLDATNFFTNRSGGHLAHLEQNQYGGTVGGPIKKDKTFFFFDWDGTVAASGTTKSAGVPSAAERTGNFGELCSAGFDGSGKCTASNSTNTQLWDPYSGVYSAAAGGRVLGTYIPYNNIAVFQSAGNPNLNGTGFQLAPVAGNLIDPVASKMMQYYPNPNVNIGNSQYNNLNNWTGSGANDSGNNQFDIRIDQRFTEKNSLSGRFSWQNSTSNAWNCFGNALDPCTAGPTVTHNRSVALILNHTFSPTTLLSVSLGFVRGYIDQPGVHGSYPSFNPFTTLGEPSYMQTDGAVQAPAVNISTYQSVGNASIGPQGYVPYINGEQTYHLVPIVTKMHGHHEIKFGGEWRENQLNWFQDSRGGGLFTFNQFGSSQTSSAGGGDSMASFLMGNTLGGSGQYTISAHYSSQNFRWGGFLQDNWRATSRLTLNGGIRYDLEIPRTERYNRMSWFDPTLAITPVAGAALSVAPPPINTATWPAGLPYVPNDISNIVGGIVFASPTQRHNVDTDYRGFGPRVGLAYKIKPDLVFRSGYGIFYMVTRFGDSAGANLGNEGFSASTSDINSYNTDSATPWGRLGNPFPGGILPQLGSSQGAMIDLGAAMQEGTRNMSLTMPYMQTWSGGLQYQLKGGWLLDAEYVGTKGTHLYYYMTGQLQTLGRWVEGEASNPGLATALNTKVANPYHGVFTTVGCGICGSTISASSLMLPYPQFSGAWNNFPALANSSYNALQIRLQKRMSNGLALLMSYTNSKSIDDDSVGTDKLNSAFVEARNPNVPQAERSLSEWDIPQVVQFSYVYELPFGKGKRWGANFNSLANGFLGGWQTNGMWRFDDGEPIHVGDSGGLCPASYQCGFPMQTGSLKTNPKADWLVSGEGYFANAASVLSIPPSYVIGNASREQPNVRAPGTNNASLSLFKEFNMNKMREGAHMEFRMEAFNALNHPVFGFPGSTWITGGGGGFGTITSQANAPREVQLGLRLLF